MTAPGRPVGTARLDDQDVQDLLTAASDGIGYWCTRLQVSTANRLVRITERTYDQTAQYTLTFDHLADTYAGILTHEECLGPMLHGYFRSAAEENDLGWIDAGAADAWLQIATFGHARHG